MSRVPAAVPSHDGRTYAPRDATADMLRRALQYVQSVAYAVSARWLFYRLLQDGTFVDKHAYKTASRVSSASVWGAQPSQKLFRARDTAGRNTPRIRLHEPGGMAEARHL